MKHTHIIIFDGQCNLCNTLVNFIIQHDRRALFSFTPLHSFCANSLMDKYKLRTLDTDTVVLIKEEKVYLRSEAVFEIMRDFKGVWSLFCIFRLLPTALNDFFYKRVAKNRYRLFGRRSHCMLPSEDRCSRFLLDGI